MMPCQEQFPAIREELKAASVYLCNRRAEWVQVFIKAPVFFLHVDLGITFKKAWTYAILINAYVKECDAMSPVNVPR